MKSYLGHFYAYLKDDPSKIIWQKKNVETIAGGFLISWVMSRATVRAATGVNPAPTPDAPIWGMALGVAPSLLTLSDETRKLRTELFDEILRKPSSFVHFLDPSAFLSVTGDRIPQDPVSPFLEIQTIFNSNSDAALAADGVKITEMGLFGGTTVQYQNSSDWQTPLGLSMGGGPVNQQNGGIMLDYVNPEPFEIPRNQDFVIALVLDFSH